MNEGALETSYAKEVISAASWGSSTADGMSPALCKALDQWPGGDLSLEELHGKMTEILERDGRKKEKDMDKKVKDFEQKEICLEQKRNMIEKEMDDLKKEHSRLLEEEEDKKKKKKEADNRWKHCQVSEPRPPREQRVKEERRRARQDVEKITQEIYAFQNRLKRDIEKEAQLGEEEKRLDEDFLILKRDEEMLNEELESLAQPLYTRLYRSAGRDDRPHITLRYMNSGQPTS